MKRITCNKLSIVRWTTYRVFFQFCPKEYYFKRKSNVLVCLSFGSSKGPPTLWFKGHLWRLDSQSNIQSERSRTLFFDHKIPQSVCKVALMKERTQVSSVDWEPLKKSSGNYKRLSVEWKLRSYIYWRIRTVKILEIGFTFQRCHYLRGTNKSARTDAS